VAKERTNYLSPRKVSTCKERKKEKSVWTEYESGGARKKRNRIRRGHCGQERSKEEKEQNQERPLCSGEE
jgi:hypothetical protein